MTHLDTFLGVDLHGRLLVALQRSGCTIGAMDLLITEQRSWTMRHWSRETPANSPASFELVYRRLVPRLGHAQAIGAIAHRICRLIWKILHQRVVYEERGPAVTKQRKQARVAKMIRELRNLGYRIEPLRS